MRFSDTVNTDLGIIQDCEFVIFGDNGYGQISGNANRLRAFTGLINRALDKVTTLIWGSDGRWQFDDTNYTDLPIATATLVDGQQDYALSVTHLKILRVEIMDANGLWYKLTPMDENDVQQIGMTEFLNNTGKPLYYDIQGGSILLYGAPTAGQVTLTNGIKVYFQRQPSYFTTSDTTKEPGFASIFHRLVSRWAAYDYALARQLSIKKDLAEEVAKLEAELKDFYSTRQSDEKPAIRTPQIRWR